MNDELPKRDDSERRKQPSGGVERRHQASRSAPMSSSDRSEKPRRVSNDAFRRNPENSQRGRDSAGATGLNRPRKSTEGVGYSSNLPKRGQGSANSSSADRPRREYGATSGGAGRPRRDLSVVSIDADRPRRAYGAERGISERGFERSREDEERTNLRHNDPIIPDDIEPATLDRGARIQLKPLSKENAEWVARHLAAAARYIDEDPELAHEHAAAAARRAGRIGVVRETYALTAYETGDFALALREFRTHRRITGELHQIPLIVDSERGVGRPEKAIDEGRSVDRSALAVDVQVSLAIAMSGARLDLGDPGRALRELDIPQLDPTRALDYSPALFHAYAEVLGELGRDAESEMWRSRALTAEEALGRGENSGSVDVFEIEVDDDVQE